MVCTPSEHRLITQSLPGENECAASADPGQELATRGMTGTGTEGVLPYRLLKPGAQVQCSSCICDDDSGVQEEVQSAGESRRGAAAEPLWSLSAGDPREMASLIAGWGDLEKSPALAPGHPGWRNGVLKVCFACMRSLPTGDQNSLWRGVLNSAFLGDSHDAIRCWHSIILICCAGAVTSSDIQCSSGRLSACIHHIVACR